MKTVLVVFTLCLVSCASYAQSGRASASEDLAAGVFVTSNLEEIKAAHTREAFAALDRIHVFQTGQAVFMVVILKGYKPRYSKEFILEGKCEILGPDLSSFSKVSSCVGGPSGTIFVPPDTVCLVGGFTAFGPGAPEGTNTVLVDISELLPTPRFLLQSVGQFTLGHPSSGTGGAHSTLYRSQAEFNAVFAAYMQPAGPASGVQGTYGSGSAATPYQPRTSQGRIGAKYGTRDPMTCPSTKEPLNGPISAEQAMLYFMCWTEGDHDGLVLIENLKLTVGKGHMPSLSESDTDMDRDSPIYPIRGSFTRYNCYTFRSAPGRNCTATDEPAATGTCYKTSFGDWHCNMADSYSIIDDSRRHPNMPPPPLR